MIGWLQERRAILAAAVGSRVLVLAAAAADHRLHWPQGPPPVHGASTAHTLNERDWHKPSPRRLIVSYSRSIGMNPLEPAWKCR